MPEPPSRELLVLRHAKSAWDSDAPNDFERPLAPRGKRDAPRMGEWLAEQGLVPDAVVSSGARRARQTARRVVEAMGLDPTRLVAPDDAIYDSTVGTLIRLLGTFAAGPRRVMIVGHNPTSEELVRWLASAPPAPAPNGKLLPTCAVAALSMPGDWASLEPACAEVVGIYRPKEVLD